MCGSGAVAVVGGGNSAGQASIFLSGTAEKVFLLLRGGDLGASMSQYLVDKIEAIENIDVLRHTEVREIHGDAVLAGLTVEETRAGERRDLDVGGLFIFIGADPCTEWLDGQLAKDDDGFLLTGGDLDVTHLDVDPINGGRPPMPPETSLPRVFPRRPPKQGAPPADAAGDEPPRRLRRRRRPHRLDQARRLGGGGGLDVGAPGPPVPGEPGGPRPRSALRPGWRRDYPRTQNDPERVGPGSARSRRRVRRTSPRR